MFGFSSASLNATWQTEAEPSASAAAGYPEDTVAHGQSPSGDYTLTSSGWVAVPAATLEEVKAARLAQLAARRWDAEVGGVTIPGVGSIDTSPRTQEVFDRAFAKATQDASYVIAAFKFGPGNFGEMNATTIIAIANSIEAHVQACFMNEEVISDLIVAAADIAAVNAVDIGAGWP